MGRGGDGDGERGRWGDGEMGRWGDGEMGRAVSFDRQSGASDERIRNAICQKVWTRQMQMSFSMMTAIR
jgi:hypothetical protein